VLGRATAPAIRGALESNHEGEDAKALPSRDEIGKKPERTHVACGGGGRGGGGVPREGSGVGALQRRRETFPEKLFSTLSQKEKCPGVTPR